MSRTCQIVPAATASMVAPLIEEKGQLRFVAEEHKWMAINKSVVWTLVSSSFFTNVAVTSASPFDNWLGIQVHFEQHLL